MVKARFDDLRPHRRRTFQLDGLIEVMDAGQLEDVVEVVTAAEKHTLEGRWVAGFVTYEAAPAFDQALYDTVWQLTSTVEAEPATGTTLLGVLSSLFPSASITRCAQGGDHGDHRRARRDAQRCVLRSGRIRRPRRR